MKAVNGSKRRKFLQFAAFVAFLIWLLVYGHLEMEMLADYAQGSDIMLAFVLAGLQVVISLAILAGSERPYHIAWAVANLAMIVFMIYALVQGYNGAGSVVMTLIAILPALFCYGPCLWLYKDARRRAARAAASVR